MSRAPRPSRYHYASLSRSSSKTLSRKRTVSTATHTMKSKSEEKGKLSTAMKMTQSGTSMQLGSTCSSKTWLAWLLDVPSGKSRLSCLSVSRLWVNDTSKLSGLIWFQNSTNSLSPEMLPTLWWLLSRSKKSAKSTGTCSGPTLCIPRWTTWSKISLKTF